MANFKYIAKDLDGKTLAGAIEAVDRQAAVEAQGRRTS